MCKGKIISLFVALAIVAGWITVRADVVLMSDVPLSNAPSNTPAKEEPFASGSKEEADKEFSPASTFKMIIALTAFEKKIAAPDTKLLCVDNVIAGQGKPLTFQEAMYTSNNDFFRQLIARLKDEDLFDMATRCKFGNAKEGSMKSREDWIHGGPFRVTPRQEHAFLRALIRGKLPVEVACQKDLMTVMRWPVDQPGVYVYGKTGSWEKTFWFSGIAVKSGSVRVMTVTLTAPGASRAKAIGRFFALINRPIESTDDATPENPASNSSSTGAVPSTSTGTSSAPATGNP
jgi:beta-lactamase class D